MLRWLAVDVQGAVVAHLPSLALGGPLRRTMGRVESQSASLLVDAKTDPDWPAAIEPFRGALIAYDGPPGAEAVVWGGIVTHTTRDLSNAVKLSLASFEAYLDRRYVGNYSVSARPQSLIVSDLIGQFCGGWPITVAVVDNGKTRDRTYTDVSDKTVFSALTELAGVIGGPQWMMGWQWTRNPDRITPVLTVGTRIGAAVKPGMSPAAMFTTEMLDDFALDVDYGPGKGANVGTATSSAQGDTRLQRTASVVQPGRPPIEYRWSPSSSITNPATLQSHAEQAVAVLKDGAQTVAFTAAVAAAPRVGVDWDLGDDIGYRVTSPTLGLTPGRPATGSGAGSVIPRTIPYAIGAPFVPATPDTYGVLEGVAQCIGYDVTPTTITPYLAAAGSF